MIYYELSSAIADQYHDGERYWVAQPSVSPKSWVSAVQQHQNGSKNRLILQHADRVWQEEDDSVKFIKNRVTGIMTKVDMREFFIVKLRAQVIR